jgi:hypothetical protein
MFEFWKTLTLELKEYLLIDKGSIEKVSVNNKFISELNIVNLNSTGDFIRLCILKWSNSTKLLDDKLLLVVLIERSSVMFEFGSIIEL